MEYKEFILLLAIFFTFAVSLLLGLIVLDNSHTENAGSKLPIVEKDDKQLKENQQQEQEDYTNKIILIHTTATAGCF